MTACVKLKFQEIIVFLLSSSTNGARCIKLEGNTKISPSSTSNFITLLSLRVKYSVLGESLCSSR